MGKNTAPVITSTAAHTAGVVTEIANLTGSPLLDTATDIITFTDADVTDTHIVTTTAIGTGLLGTFSASLVADSLSGATGQVRWTFSVADGALDFLAAGQTLTQSYTVSINDQHGGIVTQTVVVTLTGTNDLPVIAVVGTSAAGSVNELPNVSGSAAVDTTTGTVAFTDADRTDVHTVGAPVALGAGYLGTFTVVQSADSTNGVTGAVGWTFSVVDGTIDFLSAGQQLVQSYNVTIADNHGGTVTETVAVTMIGSADPTTIAPGTTTTAAVTELAGTSGSAVVDTALPGTIFFTDAAVTDTHTASVVAVGAGYVGTLTLGTLKDSTGGVTGSVGWTFSAPDGALDFLAAGQTKIQSYNVTITDNHGVSVVQAVAVTLTGTNDAPTIALATASGSVTELAATLNSPLIDHAVGAVAFKDLDLADVHTATAVAQGPGYLGTFALAAMSDSTNTGTGSVPWTFSVADGALDFLAAGQTLTQSYLVTVADTHGGSATQTVSVTLTGTNDAPVAQAITGLATNSSPIATLTAVYADPDLADTHTYTVDTTGTIGLVTNNNDGTFTYNTNGKFVGVTGTDHFNYTVTDNHGASSTQTATIAIAFDAPPVIVPASTLAVGFVSELPGVTGSPLLDTATGKISFTDADTADTHTASVAALGLGYVGSLTVGPALPDSTGGVTGSIAWTFSVVDGALDFLSLGQTLVQSYNVTVADNHGGSVVQVVTVTLAGANDPAVVAPTAILAGSVTERAGLVGSLLVDTTAGSIAFTDPDSHDTHTLSVAAVAQATGYVGALTLGAMSDSTGGVVGKAAWTFSAPDGALDFLAAGQSQVQNYNVTVTDNNGATMVEQVSVTLTGTNDAPVAQAIAVKLVDNVTPVTIVAAYTDPDAIDTHTVTLGGGVTSLTTAQGGHVVSNGNETFTYTPSATQTANDSFTYTVTDNNGASSTQVVTVTGSAHISLVVAHADTILAPPSTSTLNLWGSLLANDTDGNLGGQLNIASVNTSLTHGTVSLNTGTHSLIYTAPSAAAGGTAQDTFTYTALDQFGDASTTTVSVDPDHLVTDNWVVTQATLSNQHIVGFTAASVLSNDTTFNGGALTLTSVSGANVSYNAASGFIAYAPSGTGSIDSFSYTATDSVGKLSTGTVNVSLWDGTSATSVGSATNQAEWLVGSSSTAITMQGSAGADNLSIGPGGGTIIGGGGADVINTLNGRATTTGASHFVYGVVGHNTGNTDSSLAAMDTITGFVHGSPGGVLSDTIDLKGFGIAANATIAVSDVTPAPPVVGGFTSAAVVGYFTNAGSSVVSEIDRKAAEVHVYVDVNHDGNFDPLVDMVIHLIGPKSNLVTSDFHFS
jgi:VCBS repeat-containing protein